MHLSILILTHNRPTLFKRCIESVLNKIPPSVEIIVNNDSNDIDEIQHNQVTYFYNTFSNLSEIYEFLFKQAKGKYIFFLEDDDYVTDTFFKTISSILNDNIDIIAGNYYPSWNTSYILKCSTIYKNTNDIYLHEELLQLSQFIFKKELAVDFKFPADNNIHNDYKLIKYVLEKSKSKKSLNTIFYIQTTDGNDNISFPESSNYFGL